MRRAGAVAAALAILVAAPFVLIGLGAAPFDDPGEGMHAEIASELVRSGDPFALTLSGARYIDKPPLLYGLMAAVFATLGRSETTARLVPALSALAAVGASAWLGGRLLGVRGGLVAGLALLTSAGFFAYARYVRPETLLVAALAGGFALALVGLTDRRRAATAAGLAVFGLAGLAKDPLAALAPVLAVGIALALAGQVRPLTRWLPLSGVTALLLLAFGWWVMAERRTPGFAWYTVVDNHLLNVLRARHFPDEDVPLPAVSFIAVAVVGAAPWTLAAAAAIFRLARRKSWRDPAEVPWVTLALWAAGVVVVTACSPFRLPHYGLPAYFAIGLLAARGWAEDRGRALTMAHAIVFFVIAVASALVSAGDGAGFMNDVLGTTDVATRKAAAIGQLGVVPPWEDFQPLLRATAVVFGTGAVALVVVLVSGLSRGQFTDSPRAPGALRLALPCRPALAAPIVIVTMLGMLPVVGSALDMVSTYRAVRPVGRELATHAGPADVLVHEGALENSGALEWYAKRRPVIVDGRRSVLGFATTLDAAGAIFLEPPRLQHLWQGDRRVWLVTTRAPDRSIARTLPGARLVLASGGRWLYVNRDDWVDARAARRQ